MKTTKQLKSIRTHSTITPGFADLVTHVVTDLLGIIIKICTHVRMYALHYYEP